MNAKLLFAATVALSIASSLAMADDNGRALTREQVVTDLQQARANGTLRKTDYDDNLPTLVAGQAWSRDAVVAELAAARSAPKPLGPLSNGTYNQAGPELLKPSVVSRAEVRHDLQQAIADGTLQRTDYDADQINVAHRAMGHAIKPILAHGRDDAKTGG